MSVRFLLIINIIFIILSIFFFPLYSLIFNFFFSIGILIVPFLLHSFYKHRYAFNFSYTDTETSVGVLYQSAAMQFAIQTVVHFICCVFEYIMKVPNISVWKQERKVFLIILKNMDKKLILSGLGFCDLGNGKLYSNSGSYCLCFQNSPLCIFL